MYGNPENLDFLSANIPFLIYIFPIFTNQFVTRMNYTWHYEPPTPEKRAAAEQLDMIASGVVPVEVELVEPVVPFRNIENTILPSLDFDNAAGKEYFSLAQDNPRMEKRLKDKTAQISAAKVKSAGKKKKEEPRYRIRRDILSAQSK